MLYYIALVLRNRE